MAFSTKIRGTHHLQGNVQVYNVRTPAFILQLLAPVTLVRWRPCLAFCPTQEQTNSRKGLSKEIQHTTLGCFHYFLSLQLISSRN